MRVLDRRYPIRIVLLLAAAGSLLALHRNAALANSSSASSYSASLRSFHQLESPLFSVPPFAQSQCQLRPGGAPFAQRDSGGVRISENMLSAGQSAGAIRVSAQPLLTLGGDDSEFYFTRVSGVTRLSTGEIAVGDRSPVEIRVFNSAGRPVRRIGRRGQGPGEYEQVTSLLRLGGDTILVVDDNRRNALYFTSTGTHIRTEPVPRILSVQLPNVRNETAASFYVIGKLSDGALLATTSRSMNYGANSPPRLSWSTMRIFLLDTRAARADSLTWLEVSPGFSRPRQGNRDYPGGTVTQPPPTLPVRASASTPFFRSGSVAAARDGLFVTRGERHEIHRYDLNRQVSAVIRLCADPRPLQSADIARWRSEYINGVLPAHRPSYQETARLLPYPRVAPAYNRLLVDSQGMLWARDFTWPWQSQTWYVFDSRGQFHATVQMPPSAEVVEIGADYLLAISQDEAWVPTVMLYQLTRGSR